MPEDPCLTALAALLIQADADVTTASERLANWDCSLALLTGERTGLLRALRAVTATPNAVPDADVLARARARLAPAA